MSLSWWADIASFLSFMFASYAFWLLTSEKGKAFLSTRQWIPPLLSIGAIVLTVLHFALNY